MLRKKDVLKFLPKAKVLRKEAVTKARQGEKLTKEAIKAREISDALQGIVLHDNFPVRMLQYNGGEEVASGCDEVKRTAFVKPVGSTKKYVITTYRNDGSETDGTPVQGEYAKSAALRLAKDFVASGKKLKNEATQVKVKAKSNRGRPKKITNL